MNGLKRFLQRNFRLKIILIKNMYVHKKVEKLAFLLLLK